MIDKQTIAYIEGLIDMASSCDEYVGPSYIKLFAFDTSDYIKQFKKHFEIEFDDSLLFETDETIEDVFVELLGKNNICDCFMYHFSNVVSEGQVIRFDDEYKVFDMLGGTKGLSGFYFVEDLAFIKNGDTTYCFIMGNNE